MRTCLPGDDLGDVQAGEAGGADELFDTVGFAVVGIEQVSAVSLHSLGHLGA